MVGEQVDLVDVEDAAVRGGQQAGLEGAGPFGQGRVRGRSEPTTRSSVAPTGSSTSLARARGGRRVGVQGRPGSRGSARVRVAAETAAGHDRHRRQQRGQPRTAVDLAVPFSPRTSTPPMAGRHSVQDEGQLQDLGCRRPR